MGSPSSHHFFWLWPLLVLACGCDFSNPPATSYISHQGSRSASPIPQFGLLAFYSFDGTLTNDQSALNHGVGTGVDFTTDRFGNPSSALRFNGVDAFVEIEESNVLQIQPPLSISLWVNPDQVRSTSGAVGTNYDQEANAGAFIAFDSRGGNPSISIGDGGRKGSGSRRTQHSDQELEPGQWYHIVGVVESADDMTVYINGEVANGHLDGGGGEMAYTGGPVTLGRRVASPEAPPIYFSGLLDDLAFYGVALEEVDVLRLLGDSRTR